MRSRLPEWLIFDEPGVTDPFHQGLGKFPPPLFATRKTLKLYGREAILEAWRYLRARAKETPGLSCGEGFIDLTGQRPDLFFRDEVCGQTANKSKGTVAMLVQDGRLEIEGREEEKNCLKISET